MKGLIDPLRWEEIRTRFDEVVELDPGARASRVATLRTSDPELWDAVAALLSADSVADSWLEPIESALAGESVIAETDATAPPADPFGLSGCTFSHFQVLEPLGAGGMGVVYEARDTRLGRAVALKFLLPQYSLDPSAKKRFLQEGQSAAALDHPNLCTIHEVGEDEDGRLFLAMALYPGETLKARLARDGALPIDEALEIARQVVQGLAAAHAAGIVHRDLKPANVMLLPAGGVKILDFGLAKVHDQSLSGSGALFGTVSYMAPEQLRAEAIDGRTDLWALGVLLYEMITGRRPFDGGHQITVAHAILHDEPVAPSALRTDVPRAVEEITFTLLEKDSSRRFADAAAVRDELTAIGSAGNAPRVARIASSRRASRLFRRSRWLAGTLGLVAGIVALALTGVWGARRAGPNQTDIVADPPTRIAVFPFSYRGSEQFGYLGEGMVDLLSMALDGAGDLRRVDPHALLRALGRDSTGVPDPERARSIARRFGAKLFVLGNLVGADTQMIISGTLYDTDAPGEAIAVAQRRGPAAAIPSLIDGLAADLLNDRLKTAAQVGLRQAAMATRTTSSLIALKEYLTGERLLRAGRYDQAARAYEAAVSADSTFALAYLHLNFALLNSVNGGAQSPEEIIARAVRHGDGLPFRDRALLDAADAFGPRREPAKAVAILKKLVQYYPDDAEAWWRLAEMEFHYGLRSGQPIDQVRASLQQASALDPANFGPLKELRWLAQVEGNAIENAALTRRMLAMAPQSIFRTLMQVNLAMLTEDSIGARKAIHDAWKLDPFFRWLFVGQVARNSRDTVMIGEAITLLTDSLNPVHSRAGGYETMAHVEARRGRWTAAKREVASLQRLLHDGGMVTLGMLAVTPVAPQFGQEPQDIRRRLRAWVPTTATDTVRRLYLLGQFAGRFGEREAAAGYARALETYARGVIERDSSSVVGHEARDRALSVQARSAWQRGDLAEALHRLEASRPEKWWALYANANLLATWAYERFMRAEILTQLGRHDEARQWYAALRLNEREMIFDAAAGMRLAQDATRRGDRAQAARHYERVVALWGDADPDVPQYHTEAHAALRRTSRQNSWRPVD